MGSCICSLSTLKHLLPVLLVCLDTAASGLHPSAAARVVWLPGHRLLIDARHVLDEDLAAGGKIQDAPLPPDTIWVSSRPEGLYTLVAVPPADGTPAHLEVKRHLAGAETWDAYAVLPPGLEGVRAALPTSEGRLLLVPNGAFLGIPGADPGDMRAWAPFLLLGKDAQGRWNRFEPVDLGWGPPFRTRPGKDGKPVSAKATLRYDFLGSARLETPDLEDRLFELEEGWALVDRHHGMVWVFDARGRVKTSITLYETFKEKDLDLPLASFPTAVLACEAAPGGRLILALRNEVAFFYARKTWPVNQDPKNPAAGGSDLLRQAQAAKDFPEIVWKEVDTQSGDVRTLQAPAGLPTTYAFRPEDPNWHFRFAVTAEGEIKRPSEPAAQATGKP